MRVDLRRCDRCKGEYDANMVHVKSLDDRRSAYEVRSFDPADLCQPCGDGVQLYMNGWDVVPPVIDPEPAPGELIPTPGHGRQLWGNAVHSDVKWAYDRLDVHERTLLEHHVKLEMCATTLVQVLTAQPFIP